MTENNTPMNTEIISDTEISAIQEKIDEYKINLFRAISELRGISKLFVLVSSSEEASFDHIGSIVKTSLKLTDAYLEGKTDPDHKEKLNHIGIYAINDLHPITLKSVLDNARNEFDGIKGIDTSGYTVLDLSGPEGFNVTLVDLKNNSSYTATIL